MNKLIAIAALMAALCTTTYAAEPLKPSTAPPVVAETPTAPSPAPAQAPAAASAPIPDYNSTDRINDLKEQVSQAQDALSNAERNHQSDHRAIAQLAADLAANQRLLSAERNRHNAVVAQHNDYRHAARHRSHRRTAHQSPVAHKKAAQDFYDANGFWPPSDVMLTFWQNNGRLPGQFASNISATAGTGDKKMQTIAMSNPLAGMLGWLVTGLVLAGFILGLVWLITRGNNGGGRRRRRNTADEQHDLALAQQLQGHVPNNGNNSGNVGYFRDPEDGLTFWGNHSYGPAQPQVQAPAQVVQPAQYIRVEHDHYHHGERRQD